MNKKTMVITAGEPAGIGPDLCVLLAQQKSAVNWLVIADIEVLRQRAKLLGLGLNVMRYQTNAPIIWKDPGDITVLAITMNDVVAGQLNVKHAAAVLKSIRLAVQGCLTQEFAGLVTGPVHKANINAAGFNFTGHTEYIAKLCATDLPVMMLATGDFRVALVTTHLALKKVSAAITKPLLRQVIDILWRDLQSHFGLRNPKIIISGLNPHAGEGGYLGNEEITVITPVIEQLNAEKNYQLLGPLPADTMFTPKYLKAADAFLVMYHDQGLGVLKYAGFGDAVNITLGLPIIRTSVDHGTALDKAGTGDISLNSLLSAIQIAWQMVNHDII